MLSTCVQPLTVFYIIEYCKRFHYGGLPEFLPDRSEIHGAGADLVNQRYYHKPCRMTGRKKTMGKTRTIIIGEEVQDEKSKKTTIEKKQKPVKKKIVQQEVAETSEESNDITDKKEEIVEVEESRSKVAEKPKIKKTVKKARPKSKIYLRSKKQVEKKPYVLAEAISLVKKTSYAKFDATIELHINTKSKKGQDFLRGLVTLPAGSPKQKKIAVADEPLIEKIKTGKIDFDILISTPEFMPKLAQIAKILGPKGMMPNPKSGTVTDDVEKVKEELSSGKIEYKTDPLGNIHIGIGKVSWDEKKLMSNISAVLQVIPQNRLNKVYLCATMGPSIQITL